MRLRRTSHVTQVKQVRRVYQRGDDREGILPENSVMDATAARVEIARRCPVCTAVCEDPQGKVCPAAANYPEIHNTLSVLRQRMRTERSRAMNEILKRQVEGLVSRMQHGSTTGTLS